MFTNMELSHYCGIHAVSISRLMWARLACICVTMGWCVWLNEGKLKVGDALMCVLIGGDIRPHVVGRLKNECVQEELYQ